MPEIKKEDLINLYEIEKRSIREIANIYNIGIFKLKKILISFNIDIKDRRCIDITGQKFNKLTVLEKSLNQKKSARSVIWTCKCDCGKIKDFKGCSLRSGSVKSCGCLINRKGNKSPNFTGHKEIPSSYWTNIKSRANNKNIEFSITIEYAWDLYEKQNKRCVFTNLDLNFSSKLTSHLRTASLDRIDSSKGYVEGNVQWVHKDVNYMKQDYSDEYFIKICNLISKIHPR